MSQYVLFYSHRCQISYEFIQLCQRSGNRDKFVFVNMDTNKNIPPYVQSIPCVWDRKTRTMANMNDLVDAFQAPIIATQEPSAITSSYGSLTDSFSFLGEGEPNDAHVVRDFHYIHENSDPISTPGEGNESSNHGGNNATVSSTGDGGRSGRGGGVDMDRMVQQREQDIMKIIGNRPPPVL